MTYSFEELIAKAGKQIKLSVTEREKMRSVLAEYAAMRPRRRAPPHPLGRYVAFITESAFMRRVPAFSFALLLIVLAGGGVAAAAERALPGSPLYPIKVAVLEPMRASLTFSIAAKADLHRALAERRLSEAALLAKQNALSSTTEAMLVANFESNANAAESDAEHATTTAAASASFAARLSAYERILSTIDTEKAASTTAALRSAILAELARTASTTPAEGGEGSSAADFKEAADSALGKSNETVSAATNALPPAVSESARRALEDAQGLKKQGDELLEANDQQGAQRAFRRSIDAAARTDIFTRAAATLQVDAFAAGATTTGMTGATTTDGSIVPNGVPRLENGD